MRKGKKKTIRLCLVIDFIFYFQKLVFRNIKKKKFPYIFETKNIKHMFVQLKLKRQFFEEKKQKILKYIVTRILTLILIH